MRNIIIWVMSVLVMGTLCGCSCGKKGNPSSEISSISSTSSASLFTTTQASSKASEESTLLILRESKPSGQIVTEMAAAGWQSSLAQASDLGIFNEQSPVAIFTAKNENGSILLLSWFDSIPAAELAYNSLLPSDDNCLQKENGENYQQCLVILPESDGIWLFRQIGGCVFGGWATDVSQKDWLISVMDAFQS